MARNLQNMITRCPINSKQPFFDSGGSQNLTAPFNDNTNIKTVRMQVPKYENRPFKPPGRLNVLAPVESVGPQKAKRDAAPHMESTSLKKAKILKSSIQETVNKRYFTTMFRKPTQKKHKTWTGDGYATLKEHNKFAFYSEAGKQIGACTYTGGLDLLFENLFRAGGLEIQLDYEVIESVEYQKIRNILTSKHQNDLSINIEDTASDISADKPADSRRPSVIPLFDKNTVSKFRPSMKVSSVRTSLINKTSPGTETKICSKNQSFRAYKPVFDITKIDNPIVMNKSADADVDVIVDPFISKHLRPHQRVGVKFMYDCVLGFSRPTQDISDDQSDTTTKSILLTYDSDVQACLLADEMGLGKTLMTISLIWTLLKQTPFASQVACSQSGVPLQGLCNKVLIVCPVTLIANWKREFGKWLNLSRIGILTLSSSNTAERDKYEVRTFLRVQRTYQVLIIGYEKLLSVSEELEAGKSALNLLVCDEGHRLKNGSSKVLGVLKSLAIEKKVLLSGTPIQNDLNEFFTVIDFLNPGVLGSYQHFKKNFITPITKGRDPANRYSQGTLQKGEEKSQEMIELTKRFVLRRTNSILAAYLPPKTDIVLFCKPTQTQICAFKDILQGNDVNIQSMNSNSSLALITLLKKVCNSPSLIYNDAYSNAILKDTSLSKRYETALSSGKLKVLMTILERIKNITEGEKVVIVSNYTQTLDIIQNLMSSAGMRICRLDGSTPSKQRDGIVTSFNRDPTLFAFLLSAKSGGVGLNLIGASRLILFDNDWNPSVDLQAMSRIHRDGQKRHCYIYRLVTTGCIDEKIFQRQLMKQSLSQKFLSDSGSGKGNSDDDLFSKEDLKDLFKILIDTPSNTHDLICACEGTGEEAALEDNGDSTETGISGQVECGPTEWMNALEAQKLIKNLDRKTEEDKAKIIKQCLIGYKHINPAKIHDLWDIVATQTAERAENDITFAFVKPG